MKDVAIRALKTFLQAFLGIVIPELCLILQGTLPVGKSAWIAVLAPIGCSALAAGISAVWNTVLNVKSNQ